MTKVIKFPIAGKPAEQIDIPELETIARTIADIRGDILIAQLDRNIAHLEKLNRELQSRILSNTANTQKLVKK